MIDDVPPLPRVSLDFADWVANYTLSSPGMVLRMMMSAGRAFAPPAPRYGVRLIGAPPARMTPARARVIEAASNGLIWVKSSLAEAAGVSPGVIDGLVDAGTLLTEPLPDWHALPLDLRRERARLSRPSRRTRRAELLANTSDGFVVSLLDGVTGSGKTEVYFEAIAADSRQGQASLGPHAGNCPDEPVHRPLRAALRREARGVAFGRAGAAARPRLARGGRRSRRSSWSARAPRCSCRFPSSV